MTLLVRDEADIFADTIVFHRAQGVDHFIVTDNLSRDGTASIIERYAARGWVTSIFEAADDYSQSDWVTRMARMAAQDFHADWVLNSDADEFWLAPGGSLKAFFAELPAEANVVVGRRHDFVCVEARGAAWHHDMLYRKVNSLNAFGLPLPPKVAHRGNPNVLVHQGNHAVSGLGREVVASRELEVLHFPMRARDQFETKMRNGGAAYERNTRIPKTLARKWRNLYEIYKAEGSLEAYCRQNTLTPVEIMRELEAGSLVRDTRLADFFDTVAAEPGL